MSMMSPGALLDFIRRPWKLQGSWVRIPQFIVFVIFLLICCDNAYGQEVIKDNNEQGKSHELLKQKIEFKVAIARLVDRRV